MLDSYKENIQKENFYGLLICATGTPIRYQTNDKILNSVDAPTDTVLRDPYYESLKRRENKLYSKTMEKNIIDSLLNKNDKDDQLSKRSILGQQNKSNRDDQEINKNFVSGLKNVKSCMQGANYSASISELNKSSNPFGEKDACIKNCCKFINNSSEWKRCEKRLQCMKLFVLTGVKLNNECKYNLTSGSDCCSSASCKEFSDFQKSRRNSINYSIESKKANEKIVITRYTQYEPQQLDVGQKEKQFQGRENLEQQNQKKITEIELHQEIKLPGNFCQYEHEADDDKTESKNFETRANKVANHTRFRAEFKVNEATKKYSPLTKNVCSLVSLERRPGFISKENSTISLDNNDATSQGRLFFQGKTNRTSTINAMKKFCFVLYEFKEKYAEMHKVAEDFI